MVQHETKSTRRSVTIPIEGTRLEGLLDTPQHDGERARGVILFAHGSGSSRLSPRNQYVAAELNKAGFVTLLFDLLTLDEDRVYENRFDVGLLSKRLRIATHWQADQPSTRQLPIGYFGASTGAAAALIAAAELGNEITSIVSRGGRPDLAGAYLRQVHSPTLLLVGELDTDVIAMNEDALDHLRYEKRLSIIPGATHLFEEQGTLEEVARQSAEWFREHVRIAAHAH
ncbi:MAG: dienelactone hydrolase family protein [Candidatus Kapaibacterium sp.]